MATETPLTAVAPTAPAIPVVDNTGRGGGHSVRDAIAALRGQIADGTVKIVADDDSRLAKPASAPASAPAPAAPDAPDTADDAGQDTDAAAPVIPDGYKQDAAGRWHGADGKLVRDPTLPPVEVAPTPESAEAGEAGGAPAEAKPVEITLKGESDRGEEDIVVNVEPEIADRIARLEKGAMRKAEFTRRMDQIEAKEADFRILEARMQSNPDVWVVDTLRPDDQLKVAKALVARHWDAIIPTLVEWDKEPAQRLLAEKDLKIAAAESRDAARIQVEAKRAETRALRQVEDAIPEGTSESKANRFRFLAENEIYTWMKSNPRALPTQAVIALLLDSVSADMGLSGAPHPTNGAASATNGTKPPAARPATPAAPTVAKRQAQAAQSRVIARHVSPAGAGGAPAQLPQLPRDTKSKTPLKDRIAFLKANPGSMSTGAGNA